MLATAIAILLFVLCRYLGSYRDTAIRACVFASCLAVLSGGWAVLQMVVPGAQASGAVAAAFPPIKELQEQLLALRQPIERIRIHTKKSAEGIERVAENTKGLKKETSEDPRKELINRGKQWSREGFWQTFRTCDIDDIRLYKAAGMNIPRDEALMYLSVGQDVACLEEYAEQFKALGPELCFSFDFIPGWMKVGMVAPEHLLKEAVKDQRRWAFVEKTCGAHRLRSEFPRSTR